MFLISRILIISLLSGALFCGTANAKPQISLQPGDYVSIEEEKELCPDFKLVAEDLNRDDLSFSDKFPFILKNAKYRTASDIDKECEFVMTTATKTAANGEVHITRTNDEVCSGKVKYATRAEAILGSTEVRINGDENGKDAYSCTWKKK